MDATTLLADSLNGSRNLLKATLADFSDADLFVRPVPIANHAAWQLGHLISEEAIKLHAVGGTATVMLPEGFAELFATPMATVDDPTRFGEFGRLAVLLGLFDGVCDRVVAWVKTLSPEQLDEPAPAGMRAWAPTVGHVALRQAIHITMHAGQFQVLRRKLGKPVLF